jgi:hypothetical protein
MLQAARATGVGQSNNNWQVCSTLEIGNLCRKWVLMPGCLLLALQLTAVEGFAL